MSFEPDLLTAGRKIMQFTIDRRFQNGGDTYSSQINMTVGQEKDVTKTTTTVQDDLSDKESVKIGSTVSTKIQSLGNNKKLAKSRMTKAKKQLSDLIENRPPDVALPSKNTVRRAINKINSEMTIITKIIGSLREVYALAENNEETNTVIETLDKELEDIGDSVDVIIATADKHLEERLNAGETESVLISVKSHEGVEVPSEVPSKLPSEVPSKVPSKLLSEVPSKVPSTVPSYVEQKQTEAKDVHDRLQKMEKEQQMRKLAAEHELTKQRTDEARKIAEINKSRAENAERLLIEDCDTVKDFLTEQQFTTQFPEEVPVATVTRSPVKLKGVDLPKFSGEDKTSYEPWKAAFMAMVDAQNIPVGEKMLRLQSSLSDKALALVKDLGYSSAAYERAKLKLEKRYGGERQQQINHLTTLRNWPKVRSRNLQDLEEFQVLLERILITVKDGGSLQVQSLNLSAKEKLTEHDVQAYKYWLKDHAKEDCFESLVDWVELRVQIMGEAREEMEGFGRKNDERGKGRTRFRGFNTRSTARHCIVNTCKQDHPLWVCDTFKKLPVNKRKELISKSSRCYRCLAAGHHSKDCRKARKCGVDGCQSDKHSSYLHESIPPNGNTNTGQQLQPEAPTFNPGPPATPQTRNEQSGGMNYNQPGLGPFPQERTHQTSNADNISLMVLPALISNGQKQLKVNVMLDPCSTSSYISEHAAGELELHGQSLSLTIAGIGGTEVQKCSRCVELTVASLNGTFSAPLRAHVLDNIASDTPAFQWSELKRNWP